MDAIVLLLSALMFCFFAAEPLLVKGEFHLPFWILSGPFVTWVLAYLESTQLDALQWMRACGAWSAVLVLGYGIFKIAKYVRGLKGPTLWKRVVYKFSKVTPHERGLVEEFRHALETGVSNTWVWRDQNAVSIGNTVVQVRPVVYYHLTQVEGHFYKVTLPQAELRKKLEIIREREVPL
jgi:hypothetical protein